MSNPLECGLFFCYCILCEWSMWNKWTETKSNLVFWIVTFVRNGSNCIRQLSRRAIVKGKKSASEIEPADCSWCFSSYIYILPTSDLSYPALRNLICSTDVQLFSLSVRSVIVLMLRQAGFTFAVARWQWRAYLAGWILQAQPYSYTSAFLLDWEVTKIISYWL